MTFTRWKTKLLVFLCVVQLGYLDIDIDILTCSPALHNGYKNIFHGSPNIKDKWKKTDKSLKSILPIKLVIKFYNSNLLYCDLNVMH